MTIAPPASRNAPCPCGSGRRYKECHGALAAPPAPASIEAVLSAALAAHQAGLRYRGRHAFTHCGAAERSDAADQVEAEPAGGLGGEEVRQERAVEQIDRKRAALHVGAAQRVVAHEEIAAANVAARGELATAVGEGIADGLDVAGF